MVLPWFHGVATLPTGEFHFIILFRNMFFKKLRRYQPEDCLWTYDGTPTTNTTKMNFSQVSKPCALGRTAADWTIERENANYDKQEEKYFYAFDYFPISVVLPLKIQFINPYILIYTPAHKWQIRFRTRIFNLHVQWKVLWQSSKITDQRSASALPRGAKQSLHVSRTLRRSAPRQRRPAGSGIVRASRNIEIPEPHWKINYLKPSELLWKKLSIFLQNWIRTITSSSKKHWSHLLRATDKCDRSTFTQPLASLAPQESPLLPFARPFVSPNQLQKSLLECGCRWYPSQAIAPR